MKTIRRTAGLLLFTLMVVCFSCEEQGWLTDCSGCTTSEPVSSSLIIRISQTYNPAIINIYEGELEDGVLYASAEYSGQDYRYPVVLNKKYTVTATYTIDGNTYIAVDSAIPRVGYTEDRCDEPCYYLYDREVDLRLKYTAKNNQ